jgi:diguanylate cyclase (GGDEF)-like protein/PAS domain S-box-containing protein
MPLLEVFAETQVTSAAALLAMCCGAGLAWTLALGPAVKARMVGPFGAVWTGILALACAATHWAVAFSTFAAAAPYAVYDATMCFVAVLVSLVMNGAAAGFALPHLRRNEVGMAAAGGAIIGAAAAVTFYIGLAAVRVPGRPILDIGAFALASGFAIGGCAGAMAIGARLGSTIGRVAAGSMVALSLVVFAMIVHGSVAIVTNLRVPLPSDALGADVVSLGLAIVYLGVLVGLIVLLGVAPAGIRAEWERDRAFADLTREGIVICEDGKIVDVNLSAGRLMGLDRAALRGRAFRDFLDAPDPDRILSASLAKPQEVGLRATGGEGMFVEISSRDLTSDGKRRRVFTLRDLSDHKQKDHQIRHLAYHDPLTGLANRAAFNEALASSMKRGGEVALFCIDLDKFKEVNDVFGHSAGDEILKTAARRIIAAGPNAMAFRLGGDEFVVIGTGADAGDADKLAALFAERLNTETIIAGRTMRCGASVGYAVFPHHGQTADALFANADAALYRAKADGRGLSRGFEPEMDLALRERRALQQDLATALSRNELFLHWMPQADTKTGEINGFEALARWKHPVRGVVPPVMFIPVAEETAAIVQIGEWVLRTACREGVRWPKPGKVAVNLSPIQFQHGDIVKLVHSILLETGLPAERLELEVTEGVLLDDLSGALNTLRRLKALGVQIAMDDFGTGYSSLSYLQAFPFDRIKIDASFIQTLSTSPQAKAIVRAVVALGASLDMPITAEGVETPEQRAFLAELNCEEIQGYLVGRPSPVVSFESPFIKQRMRSAG